MNDPSRGFNEESGKVVWASGNFRADEDNYVMINVGPGLELLPP